jgi:hypothetical protein
MWRNSMVRSLWASETRTSPWVGFGACEGNPEHNQTPEASTPTCFWKVIMARVDHSEDFILKLAFHVVVKFFVPLVTLPCLSANVTVDWPGGPARPFVAMVICPVKSPPQFSCTARDGSARNSSKRFHPETNRTSGNIAPSPAGQDEAPWETREAIPALLPFGTTPLIASPSYNPPFSSLRQTLYRAATLSVSSLPLLPQHTHSSLSAATDSAGWADRPPAPRWLTAPRSATDGPVAGVRTVSRIVTPRAVIRRP